LARRLSGLGLEGLYNSPLSRARATARIIGEATGVEPVVDERLKEHGLGEGAGESWEGILRRWPDLQARVREGELLRAHIPGAEPLDAFYARVLDAFGEYEERHGEGDVVVVAHGGVFRAYLGHLLETPVLAFRRLRFGNASLSLVVIHEDDHIAVQFLNDTHHLQDGHDEA
jgi:probable phosphoglycerate mutase